MCVAVLQITSTAGALPIVDAEHDGEINESDTESDLDDPGDAAKSAEIEDHNQGGEDGEGKASDSNKLTPLGALGSSIAVAGTFLYSAAKANCASKGGRLRVG